MFKKLTTIILFSCWFIACGPSKKTTNKITQSPKEMKDRKNNEIIYLGFTDKRFAALKNSKGADLFKHRKFGNAFAAFNSIDKLVEASNPPAAVICEWYQLSHGDSLQLPENMNKMDSMKDIPFFVIVIHEHQMTEGDEEYAKSLGVDSFYTFPTSWKGTPFPLQFPEFDFSIIR